MASSRSPVGRSDVVAATARPDVTRHCAEGITATLPLHTSRTHPDCLFISLPGLCEMLISSSQIAFLSASLRGPRCELFRLPFYQPPWIARHEVQSGGDKIRAR